MFLLTILNGFGGGVWSLRATVKPCHASLDYHISVMYTIFVHLILNPWSAELIIHGR